MIKLFSSQRFLAIYSGVLTLIFAVTVFAAVSEPGHRQKFGELDVERINVVEPDGTLRMVISNKADFPGIIIKGKETPHPDRKTAGMLFFNDEGTENGGLISGGSKDKQGKVTSYGHLSFDRYEQDQVFTIDAEEDGSQRTSNCAFSISPTSPSWKTWMRPPALPSYRRMSSQLPGTAYRAKTPHSEPRIFLGRSDDRVRRAAPEGSARTRPHCDSGRA